jgi:hypothetical protein
MCKQIRNISNIIKSEIIYGNGSKYIGPICEGRRHCSGSEVGTFTNEKLGISIKGQWKDDRFMFSVGGVVRVGMEIIYVLNSGMCLIKNKGVVGKLHIDKDDNTNISFSLQHICVDGINVFYYENQYILASGVTLRWE